MPIFTFKCSNPECDKETEVVLKHSERDAHMEWCTKCQTTVEVDARVTIRDPKSRRIVDADPPPTNTMDWGEGDGKGVLQWRMDWVGIEGNQSTRMNGKYEMKAVMADGSKKEIAHHKPRRSDW
jgi:hypothetical protein